MDVGLINTPDQQPCQDDKNTMTTFPIFKGEVTPEAGNKCIQALIMLPCGSTFAFCTVISSKHNAEGNIIGHAHKNPILDTCLYDIEFANFKVTTLMTNVISKAMYA